MSKRFVTIWFRYLTTDWFTIRRLALSQIPFVLSAPDHGRMIITAANALAQLQGIDRGMVVADAKAVVPSLEILKDKPLLPGKLMKGLAEWCIRYTPVVAIHAPDSLILDATGCAHLWGGEKPYLADIIARLKTLGYHVQLAMADTIGAAWALAHYGQRSCIVKPGDQAAAMLSLPPAALRLEAETLERLYKLGLREIKDFISIPRPAMRRRFGQSFLTKLDQALGVEEEFIQSVQPVAPYHERLPCLEAVSTATGIEIALKQLLDTLCKRLQQEGKGLRTAVFKGYRVDGKIEKIETGTNRPTHNVKHLFKLFEIKIDSIEPALGIEVFTLEALKVEDAVSNQATLWEDSCGLDNPHLSELLDRIDGKFGPGHVQRYVPDEHYWPERSVRPAVTLNEKLFTTWRTDRPRPIQLLPIPQVIEVTAPVPDYPPMSFRYKGKLHKVVKADGPERIEQEWWLQQGQHRDYYTVEDEEGCRYWLFRSGHYAADKSHTWFIHGFFS
jgi:protein ImuB